MLSGFVPAQGGGYGGTSSAVALLVAPIRTEMDRPVLRDMVALYQQDTEVPFRPGLEPERCICLMADHKLEFDRFVTIAPPNPTFMKRTSTRARSP